MKHILGFVALLVLACGALSSDGTVADLRVAVGGCGACPLLPTDGWSGLIGSRPSVASVEKTAERIAAGLDPLGDSIFFCQAAALPPSGITRPEEQTMKNQ